MHKLSKLLLTCAFAGAFAVAALAAGSGGNTDTASPKKLKCKTGEVVKDVDENGKKVKKCVKASAGVLPDEELYQQGRQLAKEGEYGWALQVLAVIENQNDPRVLNYTGYSYRKGGHLEIGITYYRKALAIDPDWVPALLGYATVLVIEVAGHWVPPDQWPARLKQAQAAVGAARSACS